MPVLVLTASNIVVAALQHNGSACSEHTLAMSMLPFSIAAFTRSFSACMRHQSVPLGQARSTLSVL
jgi:hypothetical protein